jgi:hypothetical protein
MENKLNRVLKNVLEEAKKAEIKAKLPDMGMWDPLPVRDIRDDVKRQNDSNVGSSALGQDEEPADKALIAIQHCFINGDFEKASEILQTLRNLKDGTFFSWHHMNQLSDWVRNIYKYTNMKDLGKNYYEHEQAKDMEIAGVSDLRKIEVKEAVVDKFLKEAEKVLKRKLEMK